jgi:hypothetical protein
MINDTVELAVQGTVNGQAHITTLHFRYLSLAANEAGLITDWQTNARTNYRACFSTTDRPVEIITARPVCGSVPLRAADAVGEVSPNIAGTIAHSGDALPPWISTVATLRSATAGRSQRGRQFMGGLYEESITGDLLTGGDVGFRQTYYAGLVSRYGFGGTSTDYLLVVHSRKLARTGVQCQSSSFPVTGIQLRLYLATQKSRRAQHGI